MDQEMDRLKENDVYDLISRAAVPFNHKVIGTRWVYKVKSDFTFKARLVVQGWSQRPGIDLSLIHISEPTRPLYISRMPSSA